MYTNIIKQTFSAAHKIDGHPGKCAYLHGHNWTVEMAVSSLKLNELGIAIDFSTMKALAKPVIEELDHCYLNELPYFQTCFPTAENVARYIYEVLEKSFDDRGVVLDEVIIWETDGCGVKYCKNKEFRQ